jgi:hypothetical protein
MAAVVALRVAGDARGIAREDLRARVHDRVAARLLDLLLEVENDILLSTQRGEFARSPKAAALCRGLFAQRNWFGTTWHVYCEEDQQWPDELLRSGELFPRMRAELQEALSTLDYQDAREEPVRGPLYDRVLGRIGLQRKVLT